MDPNSNHGNAPRGESEGWNRAHEAFMNFYWRIGEMLAELGPGGGSRVTCRQTAERNPSSEPVTPNQSNVGQDGVRGGNDDAGSGGENVKMNITNDVEVETNNVAEAADSEMPLADNNSSRDMQTTSHSMKTAREMPSLVRVVPTANQPLLEGVAVDMNLRTGASGWKTADSVKHQHSVDDNADTVRVPIGNFEYGESSFRLDTADARGLGFADVEPRTEEQDGNREAVEDGESNFELFLQFQQTSTYPASEDGLENEFQNGNGTDVAEREGLRVEQRNSPIEEEGINDPATCDADDGDDNNLHSVELSQDTDPNPETGNETDRNPDPANLTKLQKNQIGGQETRVRRNKRCLSPMYVGAAKRVKRHIPDHRPAIMDQYIFTQEYQCPRCDEKFANYMDRRQHLKTSHGENYDENPPEQDRPFKCHLCTATFRALSHLGVHIRIGHAPKHGRFKCRHCENGFKTMQGLRIHLTRIHSDREGGYTDVDEEESERGDVEEEQQQEKRREGDGSNDFTETAPSVVEEPMDLSLHPRPRI